MNKDLYIALFIIVLAIFSLRKIYTRLQLSLAKHPSLRGHSKWSRRIASVIRTFEYDANQFFCSDGAPDSIAQNRRQGLGNLTQSVIIHSPETIAFSASLEDSVSDVRFTTAYRVPFPYRKYLSKELRLGSIIEESQGVKVKDLDNNWRYDLTGSYGVNVFGYDFYKDCMESGFKKVSKLGPVLGAYHPIIRENVEKLKKISGLDEVSFHMSGTEAVMQAVRLARYHTGKSHLVRFCGAYHGWWDGVQPGVGNLRKVNDVYTLSDLSEKTIKVLETRNDIACVLVNPLQALHPNSDAASDASLINSDRSAHFDRDRYTNWLKQIRDICARRNIVLIFDEVFTGFRLAYRGAQEFYDIQADIVTYGKTLGGGLPVGVVCGRHDLMKRFKDESPINVSFARGTFNSHPYVMGSMNEFLNRIETPEIQEIYSQANNLWNTRFAQLNQRLEEKELPVKIVNIHSICTILYTLPSRYNWMLQFYLRSEGLEMSWIGSGRMIMSLNYSDDDFGHVMDSFIRAAERMKEDGWWWQSPQLTNKSIKRQMLKEMAIARFPLLGKSQEKPAGNSADNTIKEAH